MPWQDGCLCSPGVPSKSAFRLRTCRILEKKPKSKKRLEMMGIDSVHEGMDTERRYLHLTVMAGTSPHVDAYGRVDV
jgi:hypothetical protein